MPNFSLAQKDAGISDNKIQKNRMRFKPNAVKSFSPKLTLRKECMAEILKQKAEELVLKRISVEEGNAPCNLIPNINFA